MLTAELINAVALLVFVVCVLVYAIKLRLGMKHPETAKRGLLNIFYGLWVKRMINPNETIIAVQTMRNLIMATTFLSSAMLILLGLLVKFPATGFEALIEISPFSAAAVAQYKVLGLFAALVFALIMFLLSLRHMVRFSILIGIPVEEIETNCSDKIEDAESKKGKLLDARMVRTDVFLKAMNRFTYGLRGVYYSIAVSFWFFSAYAFMAASVILTIILIKFHDIKTPRVEETPI